MKRDFVRPEHGRTRKLQDPRSIAKQNLGEFSECWQLVAGMEPLEARTRRIRLEDCHRQRRGWMTLCAAMRLLLIEDYLRKKLNAGDQPDLIHTRRGLGYILEEHAS